MFCTQCGAQNHPEDKFCAACGSPTASARPDRPHVGRLAQQVQVGQQFDHNRSSGMDWYLSVLKKYAVFSGRAQRAEYWYFILFNVLAMIALVIVDSITGSFSDDLGMGLLSGLYYLGVLVPSVAVSVRRLHDTSRSGWWLLIGLIPLVGGLILLFFTVQDSKPGSNEYGLNPKGLS
jgi:uncharacterized membrane protein YhaH (DUF805 family)